MRLNPHTLEGFLGFFTIILAQSQLKWMEIVYKHKYPNLFTDCLLYFGHIFDYAILA